MSRIRKAALAYDMSAALWRVAITQDNREIRDLLNEQLEELVQRYPSDSAQHQAIRRHIDSRRDN